MNSDSEDNILLNLTQSCTEVSKTVGIKCKRKNSDAVSHVATWVNTVSFIDSFYSILRHFLKEKLWFQKNKAGKV